MIRNFYHVTLARNISSIKKKGLVPKIGRRARKMREKRPVIYLFQNRVDAEDATSNWLGDEFREKTRLALLRVLVNSDNVQRTVGVEWEYYTCAVIPPEHISVVTANL